MNPAISLANNNTSFAPVATWPRRPHQALGVASRNNSGCFGGRASWRTRGRWTVGDLPPAMPFTADSSPPLGEGGPQARMSGARPRGASGTRARATGYQLTPMLAFAQWLESAIEGPDRGLCKARR